MPPLDQAHENNSVLNRITNSDHNISLLFENIKRIDLIIDQINKGDTKIFKALLAFVALVPIVVGILSYLNFQANTSFIDKNIELSKDKIDILVRKQTQDLDDLRSSTKAALDQLGAKAFPRAARLTSKSGKDTIIGIPRIYQEFNGGRKRFGLEFAFYLDISVTGNAIGNFVGWNVEYNGELIEAIISKISSAPALGGDIDAYKYRLILESKKVYYNESPSIIVPGYPRTQSFRLYQTAEECRELQKKLSSIYTLKDIGTVTVSPIFEKIEEQPDGQTFKIILSSNASQFSCE